MIEYRFYFLDQAGRLASLQFHQCVDNLGAIRLAQSLCNGRDAEVWEAEMLIARLKKSETALAEDRQASPPARIYG
jgi:hypothetical protein